MKTFIVEIEDKNFKKLKTFLENQDAEFENDREVIKELFVLDGRHGELLEMKGDVNIEEEFEEA